MLHAVVMAGGSGTRFWPESRQQRPKQFLRLLGEKTMLQETVGRVAQVIAPADTWIVTNRLHAAQVHHQLGDYSGINVLQEPCGRNTAPCIGLAALCIAARDPEGIMLVMPADHLIRPAEVFQRAVAQAVSIVEQEPASLVLFGIRPGYPSVSFGYIERGEPLSGHGPGAFTVASFREKPDQATAERFVASGKFYWNSGIFVWKASTILQAIERLQPQIAEVLAQLGPAVGTADWDEVLGREFGSMKSISIDHGVLERADHVRVLEAPFEWDDVGSWQALARLAGTDAEGNAIDGPYCAVESRRCTVRTTNDHLVATIGMSDCIIVHTPDATLVARQDDEQGIRRLIEILRERGYERYL